MSNNNTTDKVYFLNNQPNSSYRNSIFLQEKLFENDKDSFSVKENSNLQLSLNNISEGDEADLKLYADINKNGELNEHNSLIEGSYNGDNADDSINNIDANPGNYFARVISFYLLIHKQLSNKINLSATSNVPEYKNNLRNLSGDESSYGSVSYTDPADVYDFSLQSLELYEGLSSDAHLSLYQDSDGNGQIDYTDVMVHSSMNLSSSNKFVSTDYCGEDLLEVKQYSLVLNTNLTLSSI